MGATTGSPPPAATRESRSPWPRPAPLSPPCRRRTPAPPGSTSPTCPTRQPSPPPGHPPHRLLDLHPVLRCGPLPLRDALPIWLRVDQHHSRGVDRHVYDHLDAVDGGHLLLDRLLCGRWEQ